MEIFTSTMGELYNPTTKGMKEKKINFYWKLSSGSYYHKELKQQQQQQ